MPCESCLVQFSIIKRKRACLECERYYCSGCLRRGGGAMCPACRVLSTRPLSRQSIAHLKVRDLQSFLQRQNVSTRGCVEKEELVSLCVTHVNSSSYRRRGPRFGGSAFSSLKGFTTNINDLINSAFDLRSNGNGGNGRAQQPHENCHNASHVHAQSPTDHIRPQRERFTTTPGGERDIHVPVPEQTHAPSTGADDSAHVDTADCFEIEDVDDAGWEFITRPADPLPNDSDVLLTVTSVDSVEATADVGGDADVATLAAAATPQRAASELDLRRTEPTPEADTTSLQDVPLMDRDTGTPRHITLEQLKQASDLDTLNVKQLKELLTRNRVEFRGCLERKDLLDRAKILWNEHAKYKDEIENLPSEEWCKICMDAPLECVLLECGHIAACTACAKQLAECPICRQYVVRAVRFFRS